MERVLLYYPAINIPNGTWLKNSLLYTDKVASIFPFESLDDPRLTDDTKLLHDEGLYKPIYVFDHLNHRDKELKMFEQNYLATISSNEFKQIQNKVQSYGGQHDLGLHDYQLYVTKLTYNVLEYLRKHDLVQDENYFEVKLDKTSAIVYMSMLADYLARINKDLVIPSTDEQEFERLAYQLSDNKVPTFRLQFDDCLPTPSPDATIRDIVKFKKKRKQELLHFREILDKVEYEVNSAQSDQERKLKLVQFGEHVQKELIEIKRLMGDSKLQYLLNGFSSLLDFKQKELIGTISSLGAVSAGVVEKLPFAGFGLGAILLTATLVSSYKKIDRQVASNSLSYIYYAQKTGILIK
jgi:hypothetical protein